jgi:beta-phosphoglucomutase
MAVVLDFDGTIVRSMELHAQAYRRALKPFGVDVSDEEIFAREGARSETIIAEYLGKVGIVDRALVKQVSDRKQETYKSIGPPPLYPGAEAMVRQIRASVPKLGLVTGTRRENLTRLIPDLVPLFDALLSQESYTHDKPHPEPYAKTAEALGLLPNRCAAVENAPRGIKSARAAGYAFVVGIATTVEPKHLLAAGADVAFPSHEEVTGAVLGWIERFSAPRAG